MNYNTEERNKNEKSNLSFSLAGMTIPLARKLAVVVIMDSMSNSWEIPGIGHEIYDHGNISMDSLQSHIGSSHRLLSRHESGVSNHTNIKREKSSHAGPRRWGVHPWRSFTNILYIAS